jgi:hypothetical protein
MPDEQRHHVGVKARSRTLRFHTAAVRAAEFEAHVNASFERLSCSNRKSSNAFKQSATAAFI